MTSKATTAAEAQSVASPAESVAARIVAELAKEVLALKDRIKGTDEELGWRFFVCPEGPILTSLPGMGPLLGVEFLVAAGDLCTLASADRLAGYAGLGPAAHESGKRVGNYRRMRGVNEALKYAFLPVCLRQPAQRP